MSILLIAIVAVAGLGGLGGIAALLFLLNANLKMAQHPQTLVESLRQEREMLALQKEIAVAEITIQNKKLEQSALVKNAITATKVLAERMKDPSWAKDFEQGRDSAAWN